MHENMRKRGPVTMLFLVLLCIMLVTGSIGALAEGSTGGLVLTHYRRALGGAEQKPDNEKVLAYIEEQVGFKIDIHTVPSDQYTEKMQLVLSSGQPIDSFDGLALGENVQTLKGKQLIMPVNDLLDKYGENIKKVFPSAAFESLTDANGLIWGIPRREARPRGNIPAIREDWVKALGMEMPQSIVEFEAYMQAVLDTDLNGNGIHDEIPLMPIAGLWGLQLDFRSAFLGANGPYYITEDNKVVSIYAHPNFKLMLAKFHEWYEKGYIYKEFYVDSDDKKTEYKNANRVGAYCNWFTGGDQTFKQVPGCVYSPLPPFQDAPALPAWGSNPQYTPEVYLSVTGKNQELMIKLIDWICAAPENAVTCFYGLEGENWQWKDKEANVIELLDGYTDRYNRQWLFVETFFPGFFPTVDFTDPVGIDQNRVTEITSNYTFLENIENIYTFDLIGTPAEHFVGDGQTMIDEAMLKIIYGEQDVDSWDKVIQDYMALEGDVLSQVWTEQYQANYMK